MTLYLLNLIDLFLTRHAIQHGGVELNPFLQDPELMIRYKVGRIFSFCLMLECVARGFVTDNPITQKTAKWGLRVCTAVYAAVCIYHLYFILGGKLI